MALRHSSQPPIWRPGTSTTAARQIAPVTCECIRRPPAASAWSSHTQPWSRPRSTPGLSCRTCISRQRRQSRNARISGNRSARTSGRRFLCKMAASSRRGARAGPRTVDPSATPPRSLRSSSRRPRRRSVWRQLDRAGCRRRASAWPPGCRKIERQDPDVGDGGSTPMVIGDAIPFWRRPGADRGNPAHYLTIFRQPPTGAIADCGPARMPASGTRESPAGSPSWRLIPSGRPAPCDAGPPSEPDAPVSEHPAQASPGGWRVVLQWRWMRRGAAVSGVL